MRHLIHEIHRRSLWQVLGIYAAAAWLVLQVVDVVIDNFGLPEWVAPFSLVLLLIGLPVVLATAFVQEGVGARPQASSVSATSGSAAARSAPAVPAAGSPRMAAEAGERSSGGPGADSPPSSRTEGAHHRVLTWRNAVLGGAGAFSLLGLVTAGYLGMRALGIGPAGTLVAKGVLEERSPILVADFEGADEELANTATDALRIDLGQSHVVTVVEPTEIVQVLQRMQRPPDAPLDLGLAREIAQREGIPVVVAGALDRAGESYVVSARLIEPESGSVLASDRRTAASPSEVLGAIDALSKHLRERIGESLRDLNREEPLEAVTTGSLPALQKYSAALRALDLEGDEDRSIALLEEAVALDTAFAMAWRKLGTMLNNRQMDRARAVEALERAYRHRDRLTQRERYQVEGIYHYDRGQDIPRAITAYQNLLELDPADSYALNNLGVLYGYLRDPARAEEYYERAIAADSSNSISYTNAVQERFAQGHVEGARELLELFRSRFPGHPDYYGHGQALASATGDYEEAARLTREAREAYPGSPFLGRVTREGLAAYAAIQGRMAEARDILEENLAGAAGADDGAQYLRTASMLAGIEVETLGSEQAVRTLEGALDRFPLESIAALDRPYTPLAVQFARAGRPDVARRLLSELDGTVEPRLRSQQMAVQYDVATGYIAIAEGRYDEAVETARRADRGYCLICALQPLARAYDAAGQVDSAVTVYQRYVDAPWFWRAFAIDQFVLAPNHERLAQLYDEQGDLENAATHYARFVELWAEADPELQPRVEAAQARLQEIVRERG